MELHPAGRRDDQGRLLCRRCSEPLSGRQRSWCTKCKGWLHLNASWVPFRERIRRRDGGVCKQCGTDTERIVGLIERQAARCRRPFGRRETQREFEKRVFHASRLRSLLRRLEARGFSGCFDYLEIDYGRSPVKKSLWEADHVEPRVLGGDNTTQNGRTLCVPCHRAATKRLARYRKHRRKGNMQYAPHNFT